MILSAVLLGAVGLGCMMFRKTFLGVLIGSQLLVLGSTCALVIAGVAGGVPSDGHLFGVFILLGGVGQLAVGYALCVRLFYLRENGTMEELRSLRH